MLWHSKPPEQGQTFKGVRQFQGKYSQGTGPWDKDPTCSNLRTILPRCSSSCFSRATQCTHTYILHLLVYVKLNSYVFLDTPPSGKMFHNLNMENNDHLGYFTSLLRKPKPLTRHFTSTSSPQHSLCTTPQVPKAEGGGGSESQSCLTLCDPMDCILN